MWTIEELKADLFSNEKEILTYFVTEFAIEIDSFCKSFFESFELYKELQYQIENIYHELSSLFIMNSFNCLYMSTKLLINGYAIASGHLMRQFGESIATSLLCSSSNLSYANDIKKDPEKFPYQKTVTKLQKKEVVKALNLDSNGVATFNEIQKRYDEYSHATYTSIGWSFKLSLKQKQYFGPIYDETKREIYLQDILSRKDGCELMKNVVSIIKRIRNNENKRM